MKANPSVDYYRAAVCAVLAADADAAAAAAAGHRARAWHRHRGRLPAGGDVRSCSRREPTRVCAVSGINVGLFCSTPGVCAAAAMSAASRRSRCWSPAISSTRATAQARGLVNRVVPAERARCRGRTAGRGHHRQAARRDRAGQGAVLSADRERRRGGLPDGGPDDGLQHDRRGRAGGRAGVHGKAQAALVRRELGLDRLLALDGRRRVDRASQEFEQRRFAGASRRWLRRALPLRPGPRPLAPRPLRPCALVGAIARARLRCRRGSLVGTRLARGHSAVARPAQAVQPERDPSGADQQRQSARRTLARAVR